MERVTRQLSTEACLNFLHAQTSKKCTSFQMTALYLSFLFCLICWGCTGASVKSALASTLESGIPQFVTTEVDHVFCTEADAEIHAFPFPLFEEVIVYIKELKSKKIPWYQVKGVSTDDLHAVLERIVFAVMGNPHPNEYSTAPREVESIIRDIASSCPNPLFSSNRSECIMRFSTIGTACVTVKATNPPLHLMVRAERSLNPGLLVKLILGSILVFVSGYLGYNILFQYTIGAVAFMLGGVLILVMLAVNYLISAHNQYATFIRSLLVALLVSGVYFTSLVYYLRSHWQRIVLHHWEYVLGYLVCSGLVGMVYMQVLRNDDKMKHTIAVAVKWVLRAIGVIIVYNSSSSPLGSVLLLTVLLALYVVYSAFKWTNPVVIKTPDEEKKTKKRQ